MIRTHDMFNCRDLHVAFVVLLLVVVAARVWQWTSTSQHKLPVPCPEVRALPRARTTLLLVRTTIRRRLDLLSYRMLLSLSLLKLLGLGSAALQNASLQGPTL